MSVTLWVDSFLYDQVVRWADFYNYGTSVFPTLQPVESWIYNWMDINATFPNLSPSTFISISEQWSYLCGHVTAIYVQNNNAYSITTSVRVEWTVTYWWVWGFTFVWSWGSTTIPSGNWRVWWFYLHNHIKNMQPCTSVSILANYFLPGNATEYSEDNFSWSPVSSSDSVTASCPAFLSQGPWMVWVEGNTLCFSDVNWFKKVAQANLIASWVSAQPWLWWIDNTVWSTLIPPAANWHEYWINYTWTSWNVYRTTSQINKDTLWSSMLHKQWLMWMEDWNDKWGLWFIWPNAQKMLLWWWTNPPTNVKF